MGCLLMHDSNTSQYFSLILQLQQQKQALARDFESNPNHFNPQTGQVTCRFRSQAPNGCPHATATWDHMIEFKFDDASFLSTFRDVFMKVLHHGTGVEDNVNSCANPPCLISS